MDNLMVSPPWRKVAVVAIPSFTEMNFFFMAFFRADFVKAARKIPTPYSVNRMGVGRLGTVWVSVVWMVLMDQLSCFMNIIIAWLNFSGASS